MAGDDLVTLPDSGSFPKVRLTEPSSEGYILLALEIDRRPGLFYRFESMRKKRVLAELKAIADVARRRADVNEATVFRARLVPPGRGRAVKTDVDIPDARFDVVLLVALKDVAAAQALMADEGIRAAIRPTLAESNDYLAVVAENTRRIAPVDHKRNGVFLFNFFAANSRAQNLAVWEYTAGWFQERTGLDNSTLLSPEGKDCPYTVVNHCRWNRLRDILPALLFDKSFHSYVLQHFAANKTAAMPILYRLA